MSIVVTIHLEQTQDEPRAFVWWGESDAVAGFSAAADHLPELITRAQEALAEVAGDSKVKFLLTDFPPSPGDHRYKGSPAPFGSISAAGTRKEQTVTLTPPPCRSVLP